MPEEHPSVREDVLRDLDFFRKKLQQSKDPQEQERLKKQLQAMQGMLPSNTPYNWRH